MEEESSLASIASIACGSLEDVLATYIDIWLNKRDEWLSLNIGDPVNRVLVVGEPGMLANEVISHLISKKNIPSIKDSPRLILDKHPTLETIRDELFVFSTYPISEDDKSAIFDLSEIAKKNNSIFLISLVAPDSKDPFFGVFDDVVVVRPPNKFARKKIFSILFKFFVKNELVSEEVIDYLADLTEGMNTQLILSIARRLVARFLSKDEALSEELIDKVFVDILGEKKRDLHVSYDFDLLEQLYMMAIEENESEVFNLIKKLNSELPLSLSDQRLLSRYPFLLIGTPKDRVRLFFRARSLVKKFFEEGGGKDEA